MIQPASQHSKAAGSLKAVILDFDGVVVDSLGAHLEAWAEAVRLVFQTEVKEPERLAGHATRTIAHILAKEYGAPDRAAALARAKRLALEARFATLPLVRGARELIAELARRGLPHGIASNSAKEFVEPALASLGLKVPVVVTGGDQKRGKPHPDLFWECGNLLGIDPRDRPRVLVFEDSFHGLKAACAAKMIAIGVATEHTEAELQDEGAVAACQDLADAMKRGYLEDAYWTLNEPVQE